MSRSSLKRYAGYTLWDTAHNLRHSREGARFLVVRHPRIYPVYDVLLNWLALSFLDIRALFELHTLPFHVRRWSRYALHIPWLADPVQEWSRPAYRRALRLEQQCDARGIPIVNRVGRLTNAGKSTSARLIAATGMRTARMARIENVEEFRETRLGIPLPLFVREDWGHGGRLLRADSEAEVRALPVEEFVRPVAVELIDVRSPDGLYRKYRYVMCGDRGIRQSMHTSEGWCVRGDPDRAVFTEALRDEEIDFTSRPEPDHARFVAAREALGLDFVAFDYSFDHDGELVLWEPNPLPYLHFSVGRRRYRSTPTTRVFAAMTTLYLDRAGMTAPDSLTEMIAD